MITYDTGFGNLKTAGLESAKRIIRLRDKYSMFRVNLLLLLCIFVCFQVWLILQAVLLYAVSNAHVCASLFWTSAASRSDLT